MAPIYLPFFLPIIFFTPFLFFLGGRPTFFPYVPFPCGIYFPFRKLVCSACLYPTIIIAEPWPQGGAGSDKGGVPFCRIMHYMVNRLLFVINDLTFIAIL